MNEQDRKMLTELKVVLVGMEGTDDNGMAGDVKDIKKHLEKLNGRVNTLEVWRKVIVGMGSGILAWFVKGEIG